MASKPIKRALESIRKGKSIAAAIADSDLDADERDILVMSILDIVRETKRFETQEDWAGRITDRLEKVEAAITALIEHERKTREAFTAMAEMFEAFVTADVGVQPNPAPVFQPTISRLRIVRPADESAPSPWDDQTRV
jgi:hypothetical protein